MAIASGDVVTEDLTGRRRQRQSCRTWRRGSSTPHSPDRHLEAQDCALRRGASPKRSATRTGSNRPKAAVHRVQNGMTSSARLAVSFRSPHPSTDRVALSWAGMAANPAMGSGCVDLSHCDARKYPHIAESLCPMCWLNISRLLRPRKRQCRSDVGGAMLLHERNEIAQSLADFLQLESQSAPHAQILLNGLTQRCHRAPPGQGNASVRSALISIFA